MCNDDSHRLNLGKVEWNATQEHSVESKDMNRTEKEMEQSLNTTFLVA